MISEAERNYEPKEWVEINGVPPGSRALSPIELLRFCNTDSQAFQDLMKRQRADKAILLDYELINLGFEPTCGSHILQSPGGRIILTIFTADGPREFIEV